MSSTFIGLTMLVTLSVPPGAQLRGVVSGIEPGKSLTLRNVTSPASGKYVSEFTINAAEIVELVEATNENVDYRNRNAPPRAIPVAHNNKFEDPAIVSVGKRPTPVNRPPPPGPGQWNSMSMDRQDSARTATGREGRGSRDISHEALVESVQHTHPSDQPHDMSPDCLVVEEFDVEGEIPAEQHAPKGRRRQRKKGRRTNEDPAQDPAATPAKETTRSKGWRQTPLLEPNPSFQPFSTLKKNGRGYGKMEENGWATEDATDVQDMGDFDFAGSLAKFDKRTIFTQMQAEDSIAEEDRLVSHNRLPKAKPGTGGGKNLHYTENVLEVPASNGKKEIWKSEAGESDHEEVASQKGSGSGRARRGDSKLSTTRRPTSRKGSAIVGAPQPVVTSNPIPPTSSFFLVPSDRKCEPISALQMLSLENIADNELGLTEDMMTENAGRGIAEVALSALNSSGRGLIQGKSTSIPTVVVLAGNNKSGLRAIASGRHIRNHGLNVVVCVLGLERDNDLLVGMKRQIKVFRGFGGKVLTKFELLDYVKTLDAPIEFIVDGLLGLTISFDELRTGDQATAYELIEWANRSKASVLAIDNPTGIDPTSGKVCIIDGSRLYIHPKFVVAMAAPKKGLLEAMVLGEGVAGADGLGKGKEWQLFVVDLGLGAAVWKKAGTRNRKGVEFEGSWVLRMRFQGVGE